MFRVLDTSEDRGTGAGPRSSPGTIVHKQCHNLMHTLQIDTRVGFHPFAKPDKISVFLCPSLHESLRDLAPGLAYSTFCSSPLAEALRT
jgi:hypothetical protein